MLGGGCAMSLPAYLTVSSAKGERCKPAACWPAQSRWCWSRDSCQLGDSSQLMLMWLSLTEMLGAVSYNNGEVVDGVVGKNKSTWGLQVPQDAQRLKVQSETAPVLDLSLSL